MKVRFYEYKSCSTCQKAAKFLDHEKITAERIPIVDQPPTIKELRRMVGHIQARGGSFKNLFNTSGVLYREMKVSEKLKDGLTEDEALQLLAKNGKLIKRPFLLTESDGAVGFDPKLWHTLI